MVRATLVAGNCKVILWGVEWHGMTGKIRVFCRGMCIETFRWLQGVIGKQSRRLALFFISPFLFRTALCQFLDLPRKRRPSYSHSGRVFGVRMG